MRDYWLTQYILAAVGWGYLIVPLIALVLALSSLQGRRAKAIQAGRISNQEAPNLGMKFRRVCASMKLGVLDMHKQFLSLLAVLLLSACTPSPLEWKEDVLMPDGRTVELSRRQVWRNRGYDLGRGPTDSSFAFKDPDTGQIVHWASNDDLVTLALFKHEKTVYLLVSPQWGSSLDKFQCPDPPYFLFRWQSSSWKGVWLSEIPIKVIRVNMTGTVSDREREQIEHLQFKLPVSITQLHWTDSAKTKSFVIDFKLMTEEQRFRRMDCRADQLNRLFEK